MQCQEGHEVDLTAGVCPEGHPPAQGAQAVQAQPVQGPPVSIPCGWAQCGFATPLVAPTEANIASMVRYLEMHVQAEHQHQQGAAHGEVAKVGGHAVHVRDTMEFIMFYFLFKKLNALILVTVRLFRAFPSN